MKSDGPILALAAVATVMLGILLGVGASGAAVIVIALMGGLLVTAIGWSIRREHDKAWLPKWIAIGFAAKLVGVLGRYYMVTVLYGSGDSFRYYRVGVDLASEWRSGSIPELTGRGSFGTQVVEAFTGGLFAIITPDLLGGFVLFAILAFLGQILFYAAFRRHAQPHQLKPYAILIFLLPTYAFWPSSIGKDALVVLALGLSAYFISRSLEAFEVRWLTGLGVSLVALGLVRVHIAALVVGALVLTALVAKPKALDQGAAFRRLMLLAGGLAASAAVVAVFPDIFGVDVLSSQAVDEFAADVVRRTSSGSVGSGGVVTTPLDVPMALAHVLYRPFPWEATELQHLLAAGETALLAGFTLWRLPAVWRNLKYWRSRPYVVFSTFYLLGFAVAFSVVRNIGIIARQRGQVIAFFLVLIIGLGWEARSTSRYEVKKLPPLTQLPANPPELPARHQAQQSQ